MFSIHAVGPNSARSFDQGKSRRSSGVRKAPGHLMGSDSTPDMDFIQGEGTERYYKGRKGKGMLKKGIGLKDEQSMREHGRDMMMDQMITTQAPIMSRSKKSPSPHPQRSYSVNDTYEQRDSNTTERLRRQIMEQESMNKIPYIPSNHPRMKLPPCDYARRRLQARDCARKKDIQSSFKSHSPQNVSLATDAVIATPGPGAYENRSAWTNKRDGHRYHDGHSFGSDIPRFQEHQYVMLVPSTVKSPRPTSPDAYLNDGLAGAPAAGLPAQSSLSSLGPQGSTTSVGSRSKFR